MCHFTSDLYISCFCALASQLRHQLGRFYFTKRDILISSQMSEMRRTSFSWHHEGFSLGALAAVRSLAGVTQRAKTLGYYSTRLPKCISKHAETEEEQESGAGSPGLHITSWFHTFSSLVNQMKSRCMKGISVRNSCYKEGKRKKEKL